MRLIGIITVFLVALAAASGSAAPTRTAPSQESQLACITMNTERLPLDTRRSPLDSVAFQIAGSPVKICYGRPSVNDREIFGGLVPYNQLWRTGANEPTMIHTSVALDIAGIQVDPGSYSLYTVPGESEWQVIVNRSISQWGHEGQYSAEIEAKEVGRATVESGQTPDHVEMFTIRSEPSDDGSATVVLEWERTRVSIPVSAAN